MTCWSFHQILFNLFGIATRLTDKGHIFLILRLAADEVELAQLARDFSEPSFLTEAADSSTSGASPTLSSSAYDADTSSSRDDLADGASDVVPDQPRGSKGKDGGAAAAAAHKTLSGLPAVDGSNSWTSICGMIKEQEERFKRLMSEGGGGEGGGVGRGREGRRNVRLIFTLEDTGLGLPDEIYEKMECPFRALAPNLQQRFAGVPVLLAVAQK